MHRSSTHWKSDFHTIISISRWHSSILRYVLHTIFNLLTTQLIDIRIENRNKKHFFDKIIEIPVVVCRSHYTPSEKCDTTLNLKVNWNSVGMFKSDFKVFHIQRTLVIVNAWILNNLSLVNIFWCKHRLFYNIHISEDATSYIFLFYCG